MSLAKSSIMNLEEEVEKVDSDMENDSESDDSTVLEGDESEDDDTDISDNEEDMENEEDKEDGNIGTSYDETIIERLGENPEISSDIDGMLDIDEDDEEESMRKLEDYFVVENLEKEHPEIMSINSEEIYALTKIVRDPRTGMIIDPLHRTLPFLTKYEKARVIGSRAEQLDRGAMPMVELERGEIHGRTIALKEFEQKKIPFIIARPLPNKQVEYWKIADLEVLV